MPQLQVNGIKIKTENKKICIETVLSENVTTMTAAL